MNIEEYKFSDLSISKAKVYDGVPKRLLLKNDWTVTSLNAADSIAIFKLFADECDICHGTKGGVKGNENIVSGQKVCDYCHSDKSYFNQDRESLVSAIKELDLISILGLACLYLVPTNSELAADLNLTRNELQNLINPTNEGVKDE